MNTRPRFHVWLLTFVIASVILFPLIWGVLISLKDRVDALSMPPTWLFTPTLDHYRTAFIEGDALRTLGNSFLIATASSCLALALAFPAAYWLSRTTSRWRHHTLAGAMTTRLAPATVIALPIFLIFARLQLIDHYVPVILVHAAAALAPAIWLLTVAIDRVPTIIDDAAFLDGDTTTRFLARQIVPMCWPAFLVTAGLSFVLSWNEFFFALMLTGYRSRPFTMAVSALMTPHGTNWGQVMAICTIAIVPGLLLAIIGTRVWFGRTLRPSPQRTAVPEAAAPAFPKSKYGEGLVFLAAFRWLLLLLFSLILEKAAESVTMTFTISVPAFTQQTVPEATAPPGTKSSDIPSEKAPADVTASPSALVQSKAKGEPNAYAHIYSPLFGDETKPWHLLLLDANWRYVAGIVQIFITLLFAGKYFLCLVDPLERFAGIASVIPSQETRRDVRTAIKERITGYHIAQIALVAIPEFVLLFHAATSIAVYRQWLMFLLLLVVWDSMAFFLLLTFLTWLPVWRRSVSVRFIEALQKLTQARMRIILLLTTIGGVWRVVFGTGQSVADLTGKLQVELERLLTLKTTFESERAVKEAERDSFRAARPTTDYGPWNYLDAVVLVFGLCVDLNVDVLVCCRHFFTDWRDVFGVVCAAGLIVLLVLTLRAKGLQEVRVRVIITLVGLVLCVPVLLVVPPTIRYGEAAKAILLAILFGVSVIFLRLNYRVQQPLWQLHVLLLRIR